jgi:hypothetical protein
MKNAIFWDVTPCGSCKNRRIGGVYHFHHHFHKNRRYFPPIRRLSQEPHGVTFQKTEFSIRACSYKNVEYVEYFASQPQNTISGFLLKLIILDHF